MAWLLDNVRIFVVERDETVAQHIARLDPLGASTIYHVFGYEKPNLKVECYVVGTGDMSTIHAFRTTGNYYTLSGPFGARDYLLKNIQSKQQNVVCQTLRTDLPGDSAVYVVSLELWDQDD